MTHDPLCDNPQHDYGRPEVCLTCLEARVREDERGNLYQPGVYDRFRAEGYAAALRDAVQAVKATYTVSNVTLDADFQRAALAAIEALGGER